jgi:omega-6 fatty acid desaturase (delta-12 desaturase)
LIDDSWFHAYIQHAQEATEAIKPVLGKYYNYDTRNVFTAMWQDYNVCHVCAPDKEGSGILWYKF